MHTLLSFFQCMSLTNWFCFLWWLFLNLLLNRQCYKEDGSSKNPDCPVCSKSLNKLAQPLPMAHCANSRLVCKISGDVMNENNPPMMLPNGYVYGYNVSVEINDLLKSKIAVVIITFYIKITAYKLSQKARSIFYSNRRKVTSCSNF